MERLHKGGRPILRRCHGLSRCTNLHCQPRVHTSFVPFLQDIKVSRILIYLYLDIYRFGRVRDYIDFCWRASQYHVS